MKKIIILSVAVISLSGCAELTHLRELLTLKAYSEEQDAINSYVIDQDKKFTLLVQDVKSGAVKDKKTKEEFIASYGDPVFDTKEVIGGKTRIVSLYRTTKGFFNSDKVYLYCDEKGDIVDLKYVPLKQKK